MARSNKWKQFVPQQPQEQQPNDDVKPAANKKLMKFADTQAYQVSTHDNNYKDAIDIEISEDFFTTQPVYLEISVKDQAIKFIIQVTQANVVKTQNQRISVLKTITDLYKVDYDVNMRFQAYFRIVNEQEKTYQLSFVEILVKEHFLSRRDMVQINQKLLKTTCYTKKNVIIQYAGDFLKASIQISQLMMRDINNQEYAYTGIITEETNIVYRSLESKMAILIELSSETFKDDAIGEIALESMQKFLKVYYLRNQSLMTNHKLEIIIYARIYFPEIRTVDELYNQLINNSNQEQTYPPHAQLDQFGNVCIDIYKKVPEKKPLRQFDQLAQTVIQTIQELTAWINVKTINNYHSLFVKDYLKKKPEFKQVQSIKGELSSSKYSNLLEAITLVTQNFRLDHTTRSLKNSGHFLLILSPGNGYYFGDLKTYKIAKKNALNNNIVCMLNCFGRIPNITGPIFYLREHNLPIERDPIAPLTQIQQKYFQNTSTHLNQEKYQYNYQDRNKIKQVNDDTEVQSYLRHAYWIQIIKYNDEFLRSFFMLYDRQNQNDLLPFCFKKQKFISFSQVDFTLLSYQEQKKKFNQLEDLQKFDEILRNSIKDPKQSDHQLKQQQMGSMLIEEAPNPYNPTVDSGQQVNIFATTYYEKKPEQQEQPQTEKKIVKNNQKKKIKSHNRIKWKLYQWGWKSHQFIFQMKDFYHKLFKNYLLNHIKEVEQNLFQMEQNWKNICYVPLCPLKSVMVYEEQKQYKTSGEQQVVDNIGIKEFEDQVMGILLSENYQYVQPGEQTEDEYGSKLQCYKNQQKSYPMKFIKGGHIITLYYELQNYKIEEYNKNNLKAETKKHRYISIQNDSAIIPQLYRYNLHGNNSITCREILFSEGIDTHIKGLIRIFSDLDQTSKYTEENICFMRPKKIGLAFIPNESLQADKKQRQQQYEKWRDNFNKFMEKLKQQLRCFNSEAIRIQHVSKYKEMQKDLFHQLNLKYTTSLPEYKSQLHNEKYEQLCITSQANYCPKCIYNINLLWISSTALPIIKVIEIMEICSNGFKQVQIPGNIDSIFQQHLPFESIYKFKISTKEKMKSVKKQVRYPPYDCFYDRYDIPDSNQLLVHSKGLFFLKFDFKNLEILFKENLLYSEETTNQRTIQQIFMKLKQLINEENDKLKM
ncbi:unnamed protein product [Paramecium octaurelia]|uniref:Vacuolar membrane-associated protein Iml1 N-terminal domain-containing protein n=1 Tax=Paramecium octaurelia TaxID=43137 RepID=A0A8S1Y8Q3_PAROT|nr:unnamed protein product [Paramecium octaurelia]